MGHSSFIIRDCGLVILFFSASSSDCETVRPQPRFPLVAAMAAVIKWLDPSRPKLPPGALLAIADDLLADIYTIWLLLEDVCRLDSAVCAKWLRHHFLRLVSTKVLRFLREEIDVLEDDDNYLFTTTHKALRLPALNWILKRGIHLATLRLPRSNEINVAEQESIRAAVVSLVDQGRIDKLEIGRAHV